MPSLSKPEKELVELFIRELDRGTVSMRDSLKDLRTVYREEYPEADFEKVLDEVIEELDEVFDPERKQWTKAVSIVSRARSMHPYRFNFDREEDSTSGQKLQGY